MHLITRRALAAAAYELWVREYELNRVEARTPRDERMAEIGRALKALGPNPSPDDVNRLTGRIYWTDIFCDGCGQKVDAAVRFDYNEEEKGPIDICPACLFQALRLVDGE